MAGILYIHDITSNPYDANLTMNKHLSTFYHVYAGDVSSTLVVPTIDKAGLPHEKIQTRISWLTGEAAKSNTTVCRSFDGQPETAWAIVQELLKQMALREEFTEYNLKEFITMIRPSDIVLL